MDHSPTAKSAGGRGMELQPLAAANGAPSSSSASASCSKEGAKGSAGSDTEGGEDKESLCASICGPCIDLSRMDRFEIAEKAVEALKSSIPPQSSVDADDLERTGCMIYVALLFQLSFVAFLIYIGVNDFYKQLNEEFLSPSESQGNCDTIPVSVRNEYSADRLGRWDTSTSFQHERSMHRLTFSGAIVEEAEYGTTMETVRSRMVDLDGRGASHDLAFALTALAAYHTAGPDDKMSFRYDVDPDILFDFATGMFGISNAEGDCLPFGDSPVIADFDRVSKRLVYQVKMDNGTAGVEPCPQLRKGDFYLNSNQLDSNGIFSIGFDIRSIVTAMAVNRGMLKVRRDLRPLFSVGYNVTMHVDPAYGDMEPIYCFINDDDSHPDACMLVLATFSLVYPSMAQFGSIYDLSPCTCPYNSSDKVTFAYDECNINDVLISLAYFPYSENNYADMFDFAMRLAQYSVADPITGDVNATELFRVAQASTFTIESLAHIPRNRTQAFMDLCGEVHCTLFNIELWGNDAFNAVNSAGTQLTEFFPDGIPGACKHALYNDAAYSPLIEKAPTSLVESYYVCTATATTAFQRAMGVAAGSASLYSSILLSIVLTILVWNFNRKNPKDPILDPDLKRWKAQERVSQLEVAVGEIEELRAKHGEVVAANARLERRVEDLTKTLVGLRDEIIELRVGKTR